MKKRILIAAIAIIATACQISVTLGALYGFGGDARSAYTVAQRTDISGGS